MGKCPLWVKSRHLRCKKLCPLYPQKRTFGSASDLSALAAGLIGQLRYLGQNLRNRPLALGF